MITPVNRRRVVRLVLSLVASLILISQAEAADINGRFIILGFGSESCGTYVAERKLGKDNPYRGWLTGYLSAYNESLKNTYNVLGNTDVEAALLWIDKYCNEHPLDSFADANKALLTELLPRRQVSKP